MVSEEAIRRRSHEIWVQEGRPEGRALEHWLRAEAELGKEQERREFRTVAYHTMLFRLEERQRTVMPRPRISTPPQIQMAQRIRQDSRSAAA
jgi:hypothetical protein